MVNYARMERITEKLVRQHAPNLLNPVPSDPNDKLRYWADGLAKAGVLILTGEVNVPERLQDQYRSAVSLWVISYGQMYDMLARRLFPSLATARAVYADEKFPPVIVLEGDATFVTRAIASYIVPYVAARQKENVIMQPELTGVMMSVLKELDAEELPREDYNKLMRSGQRLLWGLLKADVHQQVLTTPASSLFRQVNVPPPPPEILPEEPTDDDPTPTERMFSNYIPMRKEGDTGTLRRPPVPPLRKKN